MLDHVLRLRHLVILWLRVLKLHGVDRWRLRCLERILRAHGRIDLRSIFRLKLTMTTLRLRGRCFRFPDSWSPWWFRSIGVLGLSWRPRCFGSVRILWGSWSARRLRGIWIFWSPRTTFNRCFLVRSHLLDCKHLGCHRIRSCLRWFGWFGW